MRTNLNTILATIGVSFSLVIISASDAKGQTWYDSEGRPLVVKGKKVIRKVVDEEVSKKEKENASPIIPKVLELRPELSTVNSSRSYPVFYPYSRYHYGYRGYSGSGNYHHQNYRHYNRGCYRPRGVSNRNLYLNYRRGGVSIRARF